MSAFGKLHPPSEISPDSRQRLRSQGTASRPCAGAAKVILLASTFLLLTLRLWANPATPDAYDVFYLRCDGTGTNFTDSSITNPKTITVNGNATQLPIKFNKTAGFFNGITDYVVVPDSSDCDFGTGQYDIDLFVNYTVLNATHYILDIGAQKLAIKYAGGNIQLIQLGNADVNVAWTPALNTWYHIRIQKRISGTAYLFLN